MKNTKYYFPMHIGSGNRGCEGIIRGAVNIFALQAQNTVLCVRSNYDWKSDVRLGINEAGYLKKPFGTFVKIVLLCIKIARKLHIVPNSFTANTNFLFLRSVNNNSVVFITGGDLYCYEGFGKQLNAMVEYSRNKGAKTVLLGCSVEKKLLTNDVIEGMKAYDIIIARESLSFETLHNAGLDNLYLYPDSAFVLKPVVCELPTIFRKTNVVGVNISPYTNKFGNNTDTPFFRSIVTLIDYIINKTSMSVCFIPHVFWKDQDDRIIIRRIHDQYKSNERIIVLDSEVLSYMQIRYIISQCSFFIGSRTHSVISAYATQVPAIALGYSVKSTGIAKDIGMPDYTVVDTKNLSGDEDILNAFIQLMKNEPEITEIYNRTMKGYIERAFLMKEVSEVFQ